MYISAVGNISAQQSFVHSLNENKIIVPASNRLSCIEPDYKEFIDAKLIRRMSRIIRMGTAAAMACINESGLEQPDAIIVGTAYGCMEDTTVFLSKLVENDEEFLTPTAFIQSTHNTVGAQIALILKCHQYNNTFVHRGFSFEHALLDAWMLLKEENNKHILVGGIDEITDKSHGILTRFGTYKKDTDVTSDLFHSTTKGTIAGEGAGFFMLSKEHSEKDYAKLEAFTTFYKPVDEAEVKARIKDFILAQNSNLNEIDLVLLGVNGDIKSDAIYHTLSKTIFSDNTIATFKNCSGEYPTATNFALWYAAQTLKNGKLPFGDVTINKSGNQLKKILIYNHYQSVYHSLFLLSAC